MVFVTGDTHIPIDIKKLNTTNFPLQKELSRNDILIVLGDFGLLWKEDKEYLYWKKWLEAKQFTVAWLDGNHENFDWIDRLPVSEWNGGKVHQISDNIIHLMRGQVFRIQDKTFFVCGGATSTDKEHRTTGLSWWPQEDINFREIDEALDNLETADYTVDYVLTHTCPNSLVGPMFHIPTITDPTAMFLNEVYRRTKFGRWFFGHWHEDRESPPFSCVYNKIIQVI